MTMSWRNNLWYTCSFLIGLQDLATLRVFSRGFTKNGACSLDCFTYKSSSSALVSSSFVFHGFFACFPSPFIDGVSWIKYFKRVFIFDVSIPGQFLLSFALQGMSHPGEKENNQVTARVITSKIARVASQTNHIATKTRHSDRLTNRNQTIPFGKKFRLKGDSNPWLLWYQCSALPTELSSQLWAGHIVSL